MEKVLTLKMGVGLFLFPLDFLLCSSPASGPATSPVGLAALPAPNLTQQLG
jgi:hypothetical protein